MPVSAWEHFGEPIFVVFRHLGYTDVIQIDLVLPVKPTASGAKLQQRCALFPRAISSTSRSEVARANP